MMAYVYTAERRLVLKQIQDPPLREDTAIMRVMAAAICGTDVRTHRFGSSRIRPPRVIGHEACGIVERVGAKRPELKPGDRVMIVPAIGCGSCRWCRMGHTNMCASLQTIGFDCDGAFAEYMEIPAQAFAMGNLIKLEEGTPFEEAALAEPVACCLNGQSYLRIGEQDVVLIFGAGFIGCVHAELALASKAKKVIIADVSATRLGMAKEHLSGIETIDSGKEDVAAAVDRLTEGRGADVIITACPVGETHAAAIEVAATKARISLFGGIPGSGRGFLDSNAIHYKELSIFGSHASSVAQNRASLERISSGEIRIGKYISAFYPLERIEEAFEALKSERVLKVIIKPQGAHP